MIRRFTLRDFKGHRYTQLALGRLTMLVGDNASGKTSVLAALALQADLCRDAVATLRGDSSPPDLLRRGAEGPIVLASESSSDWETRMELRAIPPPGMWGNSWSVQLTGQIEGEALNASLYGGDDEEQAGESWHLARSAIGIAQIYHLHAEQIAAAAYSTEPDARIKPDGRDTAEALAAMKLGNDEVFQRVEDALRSLIPTVERVRIRREAVQRSDAQVPGIGSKLYFDFRGAPGIPAHGASHGTLIVLALLAILHGPNRPNLILLDDFDHALHPRAQMELVRMIKHLLALEELKEVQVVATTHSPYTLDELDPIDVYAFALRDDGTVASRRLSEHPEAENTRGTLKAGQLWSLDPERDWVLRG